MAFNRHLFKSLSGEWSTPQGLFDDLDAEFHFTLDACATSSNAKVTPYLGNGINYPLGDGLSYPWNGVVWCNPPYGREIGKWIKKGYEEAGYTCLEPDVIGPGLYEHTVVVMLIPSRTDTRWWHDYVMKAKEIRFIKGRLKFGGATNSAPFPSAIVVFGGPNV